MNNEIKQNLFSTEVFKTTFIFQDLYDEMNEDNKKKIDDMDENQLYQFIENNKHQINRGFENGIMTDWSFVAKLISNELNYELNNKKDENKINEYCPYCQREAKLENKFIIQRCNYCGGTLFPCSICPDIAKNKLYNCSTDCKLRIINQIKK